MPHRPALRAERTMPRQIRAARFFWKMPRYTTSHVKCAIAPPQSLNRPQAPSLNRPQAPSLNRPQAPSLNRPQAPSLNRPQGLVHNGHLMVRWSDQTMPPTGGCVNREIDQAEREVPLPRGLPDDRREVAMDGGV